MTTGKQQKEAAMKDLQEVASAKRKRAKEMHAEAFVLEREATEAEQEAQQKPGNPYWFLPKVGEEFRGLWFNEDAGIHERDCYFGSDSSGYQLTPLGAKRKCAQLNAERICAQWATGGEWYICLSSDNIFPTTVSKLQNNDGVLLELGSFEDDETAVKAIKAAGELIRQGWGR